jgi:hypothetical protein
MDSRSFGGGPDRIVIALKSKKGNMAWNTIRHGQNPNILLWICECNYGETARGDRSRHHVAAKPAGRHEERIWTALCSSTIIMSYEFSNELE